MDGWPQSANRGACFASGCRELRPTPLQSGSDTTTPKNLGAAAGKSIGAMTRIFIYDTTLRDGSQGEGVNFSLQDKLLITSRLDELGFDYIEGGYPLSNPKDAAYFRAVRDLDLKHAKVAAFGMTRRRDVAAEDDQGMKALVERADERHHDRGEELGPARSRCSRRLARRKREDDRRLGGLLCCARARCHL